MKDLIKAYKELEAGIDSLRKELGWLWLSIFVLFGLILFIILDKIWKVLGR